MVTGRDCAEFGDRLFGLNIFKRETESRNASMAVMANLLRKRFRCRPRGG